MSLREQIQAAMKDAMRARESERLVTIRMLLAAIKQREVDERREMAEADILGIVDKLIKQRKDSAQQFRDGGRPELAEKEEREIAILQTFLPSPLSAAEIDDAIRTAVAESNAAGPKDMGKVLGLLRPRMQGRADMAQVADRVKAILTP